MSIEAAVGHAGDAGRRRHHATPTGDALRYRWFFYPGGRHGHPRTAGRRAAPPGRRGAGRAGEGGIPSAPAGGPPEPPPRVVIENADGPRATVVPKVAGIAHVILAVEDGGRPSLTSYRRVVFVVK